MKWILPLFIFSSIYQLPTVWADTGLRLYEWHAPQTLRPLILPVKSHETPAQAAARYVRELEKQPALMELFEGRSPDLSQATFKLLGLNEKMEERALIMANAPRDYTQVSRRIENFSERFAQEKTRSYILPINANLGLSQEETRDLFKMISNEFPLLVNLGGDDVDPKFYKKENFHARNTIPIRDKFEIALIRSYTAAEKGFHFAVCRGAQITAVALGYKLIQDIPFHLEHAGPHAENYHDIRLVKTTHGMLADAVKKSVGGLSVNSLHHQAIIYKDGGPLELAAVGEDGITEALEAKNGRTFLTQFHPELMDDSLGLEVVRKVVERKDYLLRHRCEGLFAF